MSRQAGHRPFYARLIGLRHLRPGPLACFVFLEGSIALAGLLVLAGVVNVWALIVLPVAVAAVVKLNDVVTGGLRDVGDRDR